jgi:hypothetical protein
MHALRNTHDGTRPLANTVQTRRGFWFIPFDLVADQKGSVWVTSSKPEVEWLVSQRAARSVGLRYAPPGP